MSSTDVESYRRPLLLWGGTVGFALGSIVDVVVFHLVFQHHHLLSGYIDPHSTEGLRTNVRYDGLFLTVALVLLVIGGAMVWRTANRAGSVLVGAGTFNVLDGIVSHYLLNAHDVVHGTEAWNPHWIVVSLLLLGAGRWLLNRADGPDPSN